MKSQDQLLRLLGLLPYLSARPGVSVTDAAAAFGITRKQLMDDLNTLWVCGLPGGLPDDLIDIDMDAVETDGVIHLTNAEYLSRPMRLLPDEVLGLVAALQSLAEVAPSHAAPAIDSTLDKLRRLLGTGVVPVALEVSAGEVTVRDALVRAIDNRERLRLTYHGRDQTSTPHVDPARIDVIDGYAYLEAWSVTAGGWRSYRVDRIERVDAAGAADEHGEPRRAGGWFDDAAGELVVRLAAPAQWVVEYLPTTSVEADGDDLVVTFPVVASSWATALLLRLGEHASVVSPSSVLDDVRTRAAAALARYRELGVEG